MAKKQYWCIPKPSAKVIRGLKVGITRLAIMLTVGVVSYLALRHFHVAVGVAASSSFAPSYLTERILFEWIGDAFADAVEV